MQKIIEDILNYMGCTETEVAIKKPLITFKELVTALIEYGSITNAAPNLNITIRALEHRISRELKSILPEKSRSSSWDLALLSAVGYKRCPQCTEIKPLIDFSTRSECKKCDCIRAKIKHADNPELGNARSKRHYLNNKEQYISRNIVYKTKRALATPSWADLDKIKSIYEACPEGYHVDHIIPLQGELVSGLHVENNLQYLTALDNIQKSNSFSIMDQ